MSRVPRRVLLLGYPVEHSLSGQFQNAAFDALSLGLRYELCPLPRFEPNQVDALLRDPNVAGANVTRPYKEAILPIVDRLLAIAEATGAVNTVFKRKGADGATVLVGENTDVGGLRAALEHLIPRYRFRCAIVLGAGGAARAAMFVLSSRADRVVVINRTIARARRLVEHFRLQSSCASFDVSPWPLEGEPEALGLERKRSFRAADLVLDATSLGHGLSVESAYYQQACRSLSRLPLSVTSAHTIFYDVKTQPNTPLLSLARNLDRKNYNGLGMLVLQGAMSFRLWTNRRAPLEVMSQAVGWTAPAQSCRDL